MEKGIKSRRKILEVAFKLFGAYSYPDVSYSLLEEASGISRGSMVYYFNNKEGIFRAVLETFLFNIGRVRQIPESERETLKGFCKAFIDQLSSDVTELTQFRIPNLCDARFTIERSALQFVPEFRQQQRDIMKEDEDIWVSVIKHAISTGELRSDIDAEAVGRIFLRAGNGWMYSCIYDSKSSEQRINELRDILTDIYNLVVAK